MSEPNHPGTIEFVDGKTQKVTHTIQASEAPREARFAPTPEGLVPVVKVVSFLEGDQRTIREYGPDGQLLRSTLQVRNRPR